MSNIDELLFSAAETENEEVISKVLDSLSKMTDLKNDDIKAGLEFLLESWGESVASSAIKAQFCYDLALLNPPDSSNFRICLQRALNKLNQTTFPKSTIIKATALKDSSTSPALAVERFHILQKIKAGIRVFNPKTKRLGVVAKLDDMTSEVILQWDENQQDSIMPLDSAVQELVYFKEDPIINQLSVEKIKISSKDWRETLKNKFISSPKENIIKQIAQMILFEQGITPESFHAWWAASGSLGNKKRHPSESRSILEFHTLIQKYKGADFSDSECAEMDDFYRKIKASITSKDAVMLIESTILLAKHVDIENIRTICGEIKEKLPFWPPEEKLHHGDLSAWSKIPAKSLPPFAELTISVFSKDYMAELLLQLPIRCWTGIVPVITPKLIFERILKEEELNSDAIMWLWRNRKKAGDKVLSILHPRIITDTLNRDIDDSSTQAAKLKDILISDENLQALILDNVKGSEMDLLRAVQTCDALRMDEKQSLLVKCSRLSTEVKKYIEKGDGKKMFSSAGREHAKKQQENQLALTSVYSFQKLNDELNDIISKQIPENSAAIAHARSYGDLRENAEYKAAKERQAFLQKRRAELEQDILNTQATDFSEVEPDQIAIPGSEVTIHYIEENSDETFYLLGIWDSDPEKNHLSSASKLGQMLKGKAVGNEIILPDGRKAKIKAVNKLPADLLKVLAG